MNDDLITRLVVGGPISVQLGRPVGQRLEKNNKTPVLRWHRGAWAGGAKQSALSQSTFSVPLARLTLKVGPSRARVAAIASAAGLLVAAGAALGVHAYLSAPSKRPMPVATVDAREASPVTVVSAPFVEEPAPSAAVTLTPPLPIAAAPQVTTDEVPPLPAGASPAAVHATAARPAAAPQRPPAVKVAAAPSPPPAAPPAPPVPITAPRGAGAAVAPVAAAPKAHKEPESRPPSVLLDDPTPAAARAVASKPSASAVQIQTRPAEPPKQAPARGTGLVTITPDAKFAVFSNPKTRLPEQFKVGDTLPSGETLRSIDYKLGRVITSSKEYSLD